MSLEQKLDSARQLLNDHNLQVTEKVEIEKFFLNLRMAGGTTEQALSKCTWEDLMEFGLPRLLARQVAEIFQEKEEKKSLKKSKVEVMSVGELISHYDPKNKDLVQERLKQLFENNRVIIFNNDGTVNVEASTNLAKEVNDGFPDMEFCSVDGEPQKVYRVGESPDQSYDENPLYPSRMLRSDGICDQTNRSWKGVPFEVKQIVYLAVKNGEIKVNSINDAHNILDLVVGKEDALKIVKQRFIKAAATLNQLKKNNQEPNLKIYKNNVKDNNPFGQNRVY